MPTTESVPESVPAPPARTFSTRPA